VASRILAFLEGVIFMPRIEHNAVLCVQNLAAFSVYWFHNSNNGSFTSGKLTFSHQKCQ